MPDDPLAAARAEATALRARLAELDARMTAPRQVTRAELESMTPDQINAALETGALDAVLGATGTRHAMGPLTAAELADLDHVHYTRVASHMGQVDAYLADQNRQRSERQREGAETALLLRELDAAGTPDARYRAAVIRQSEKETPR